MDACRYVVRDATTVVSLATRPVLFALARALGEAWPGDVARDTLLARAFRAKHADESHRARLRVELAGIVRALDAEGIKLQQLELHAPSLDDVFLAKTGRSLEGAGDEEAGEEPEAAPAPASG